MRVLFREVLYGVATRLGLEPEVNLQGNSAAALTRYLQHRVEEAWDSFGWPWARVGETRRFARDFSAVDVQDIFAGDIVWYNGGYWRALGDAPVSTPIANSEWEVASGFDRLIEWVQPGFERLGTVTEVWDRSPRLYGDARELAFEVVKDGVLLGPAAPDEVWVVYDRVAPLFSAVEWSESAVYGQGDVVFAREQGDCFVCRQAHQGVAPPISLDVTAKWERQWIPRELRTFLELAAFADALAEDGGHDKARAAEARAKDALERQMEKIVYRQGQRAGFGVMVRDGAN